MAAILVECVIEGVVEDAPSAQQVYHVVVALAILVTEGEAWHLVVVVAIFSLAVGYEHLLANVRLPLFKVDDMYAL